MVWKEREVERAELDRIERLDQICFGAATWPRRFLRRMFAAPEVTFRAITMSGAEELPLGFYIFQAVPPDLYLANLVVEPYWRRKGVASFALTQLNQTARALRVERILLDVQEENLAAQLLYRKHGYRVVEILRDYYGEQDGYRMHAAVDPLAS